MPWGMKKLDDGRSMPEIAFGSATVRHPDAKAKTVDDLVAALDVGFSHLDTAQRKRGPTREWC